MRSSSTSRLALSGSADDWLVMYPDMIWYSLFITKITSALGYMKHVQLCNSTNESVSPRQDTLCCSRCTACKKFPMRAKYQRKRNSINGKLFHSMNHFMLQLTRSLNSLVCDTCFTPRCFLRTISTSHLNSFLLSTRPSSGAHSAWHNVGPRILLLMDTFGSEPGWDSRSTKYFWMRAATVYDQQRK